MTTDFILSLAKDAFTVTLLLGAPMLIAGLIAGILMSIFQTVTSIREQTLIFIPKMIAVMAAIIIFAPWMLNVITTFTKNLFLNIANYVK